MSQTLTALSALSNPPVLSEANAFAANVAAIQNLDNRRTLALRVLSKAYQLNSIGGTDYRSDFPLLVSGAATIFGAALNITTAPYGAGPVGKWEAVLDWNAGHAADATLSTDVQTLVNQFGILAQYTETQLMQMLLFLKWKLAE